MIYYYYGRCPECKSKHVMFAVNIRISESPYVWECPSCHKKGLFTPIEYLSVDPDMMAKELPYKLVEINKDDTIKEVGAFRAKILYEIYSKRHKMENTKMIRMESFF